MFHISPSFLCFLDPYTFLLLWLIRSTVGQERQSKYENQQERREPEWVGEVQGNSRKREDQRVEEFPISTIRFNMLRSIFCMLGLGDGSVYVLLKAQ